MVVTVTMDAPTTVTLDEPGDVKRFHVAVRGGRDRSRLAAALADWGTGQLDGDDDRDDVWVRVAWVRAEAAGRVDGRWEEGFAGMLAYASTKGWLDATGALVRAHVEWERQ